MMMIAPPPALVSLFEPWASFYGDSLLTSTIVTFAHVGALVVGGGVAIAADRTTLRVASDVDRRRHLLDVSQMHRFVVTSLVINIVSGFMLFASDVEAHWESWIFWVKMVLVVLLLVNGARMRGIETRAATESPVSTAHWSAFRGTALVSIALWLTTTLAGVALLNYA
jgi:uncharacterized membrane protein